MKTFLCTDIGNAERLVEAFGTTVRYVADQKRWIIWDGKRWAPDVTRQIESRMKAVVRDILLEAHEAERDADRRDLLAHAKRSEADAAIRAAIRRAEAEPALVITSNVLDADPWLFNVENGTLDLRTQELRAHRPEDMITKMTTVTFDKMAQCPQWLAFLNTIMLQRCDLVGFLGEAFGYSLTGSTQAQCLFFLIGRGGNGKSTLLTTLRWLLDEYATAAPFDLLLEQRSGGPRNDIARLRGSRVVTAVEVGRGQRMAENVVKELTGSDEISARPLYQEAIVFRPSFKIWLAANDRPAVRGTDDGIWRRFRMIPFDYRIPDADKVEGFEDRFIAELPGILNWAVAGIERYIERGGFNVPEAVAAATKEYRDSSDVVAQFLEERAEFGPGKSESQKAMYENYCAWCLAEGERPLRKKKLEAELVAKNFKSVRRNNREETRWLDVRLVKALDSERGKTWEDLRSFSQTPLASACREVLENSPTSSHVFPESPDRLGDRDLDERVEQVDFIEDRDTV